MEGPWDDYKAPESAPGSKPAAGPWNDYAQPSPEPAQSPAQTGVTAFLKRQLGGQGEQPYGSGLGYLIDNPVTRGLGGAANELATGASELVQRGVGVVSPTAAAWLQRNVTQPLAKRQSDFEAPKTAGIGSDITQAVSNLGGQLAFAGLAAGPGAVAEAPEAATGIAKLATYLRPSALRAAGALGFGNAAAQAAQQEAQTGTPESTAKLLGTGAAMTAGNLIPLGGKGGVLTRAVKGAVASEGINEGLNLVNGQPLGTGALMATGLGAGFGLLPHAPQAARPEPFPGAAPGTLSDAANTLHRNGVPPAQPQTGSAEGSGAAEQAKAEAPITVRTPPPPAPWINPETGEVHTPSAQEIVAAMHGLLDTKAAAEQAGAAIPIYAPRDVAEQWGLPLERVKSLMKVAGNERRNGMTTEQAIQRAQQAATAAPEAPTAETAMAPEPAQNAQTADLPLGDTTPPLGSQPDLLSQNPNLTPRQRARIAQRIRGGGVAPGVLDAAAEEATAGARAAEPSPTAAATAPTQEAPREEEPIHVTPQGAGQDTEAQGVLNPEPNPQTPPQGGVSASEPPKEETDHAQQQPAEPARSGRGTAAGEGERAPEGARAAVAETAGSERGAPGAAGTGGHGAAAVPAEVDTTALGNALSKTDRATGPDGATYMVKQNNNGEGYHVTRSEDGSSTQHRSPNPAQPWTREEAVNAATQLAQERAAASKAAEPPAATASEAAAPAGEPAAPSAPAKAPADQATGEGASASEPPQVGNGAENTPKAANVQETGAEQPAPSVAPEPSFKLRALGSKGLVVEGDAAAIRARLKGSGFNKAGRAVPGGLRFDAADRPRIEPALAAPAADDHPENSHATGTVGVEPVRGVREAAPVRAAGEGEAANAAPAAKKPRVAGKKPAGAAANEAPKEGDTVRITKGAFKGQVGELRGVSGPNLRNVVVKEGRKAGVHSIHVSAIEKAEPKAEAEKAAESKAKGEQRDPGAVAHDVGRANPFESTAELVHRARDEIERTHGKEALEGLYQGNMMRADEVTQSVRDGQYEAIRDYAAKMPVPVTEDQIGRDLARRAFEGTSHRPEERGDAAVREYVRALAEVWRKVEAKFAGDPEALARAKEAFANLQRGYADRLKAYLQAHSNVVSTMIAGPAKFPQARMEKLNRIADKRAGEANEFFKRTEARLFKEREAPVDKTPQGELARVRANLQQREARQERMKAANEAIRRKDDAKLRELGYSDAEIAKLKKPDDLGRIGYPDYSLRNNNAEIRRLRARATHLESRTETAKSGPTERTVNGVRVEEDARDNRIRLRFDGKPDEATRAELRGAGWKWSPKNEAWQRQLTNNARESAERILRAHAEKQSPEGSQKFGLQSPETTTVRGQGERVTPDTSADKRGSFSNADEQTRQPLSEFLRSEPIAEAGADALPPQPGERAGLSEITRRVVQYLRAQKVGTVENPEVGKIVIAPTGVRSSLSHGYGRAKIAAFALLRDVLEKGRLIDTDLNYQGHNHDRLVIGAPVRILGKDYLMGAMVKRDVNGTRYYLHEVTLTPKEEPRQPSSRSASTRDEQSAGQTGAVERILLDAFAGNRDGAFFRGDNATPSAGRSASGGIDRAQLDGIVRESTAKWGADQPRVRVVDTPEQLPAEARADPGYRAAEGYISRDGGTVYLVRSKLGTPERARQVLAHEAIGHYGVDRVVDTAFGAGAWQKVEDNLVRLDREGLGSDAMKAVLAETHRRYPDADPRTFAKEAIAVMAEKGVRNGILDRVVAAVRKFLRRIMPNLKINEAELRQLLVRSDRLLRTGEKYSDRVARVQAMAFDRQADPFYSALTESVAAAKGAPKSADAAAWKQWLDGAQRRGEFKGSEREWLGLDQWLDQHKGPITRAELNGFVRENQVRVQEVMHGDEPPSNAADLRENEDGSFDVTDEGGALANTPDRPTKFGEYTLPGGENYRELLLTMPSANDKWNAYVSSLDAKYGKDKWSYDDLTPAEQARGNEIAKSQNTDFNSAHFNTPNILAHVRMNDRIGPDGERILHVEEIQSDWHQAGRKQGYTSPAQREARRTEIDARMAEIRDSDMPADRREWQALNAERKSLDNRGVPDAPFKKEWPMLAMKRVLRYAAEHDYDKVTWTTGEQQAERYDLSKQVDAVQVMPHSRGDAVHVMVKPVGAREFRPIGDSSTVPRDKLAEVLGKDLAQKALRDTANGDVAEYKGLDLKVGGEGMHGFYDKMLPNEVNKYVKQWGAKVGTSNIDVGGGNPTSYPDFDAYKRAQRESVKVHSLDITPAMRESVMKGQPLFSRASTEPQATMDNLDEVMKARATGDENLLKRGKAWLGSTVGGKFEDLRPKWLGALPFRHVLELAKDLPILKGHAEDLERFTQQMDADRNHLMVGAPDAADHPKDLLARGAVPVAQALREWAYEKGPAGWLGRQRPEAKRLFDLMHKATIWGLDPDKAYERLTIENAHGDAIPWTKEAISARLKLLREMALQRGGDPAMLERIRDEKKYLRNLPKMERTREQRFPELVRQWQALSDEAKQHYRDTRDWYSQFRDAVEEARVRNIEQMNMQDTYKRSLVNRMRLQFEEARRTGVYFPLQRFGDYWIAYTDKNGEPAFEMFESYAEARSREKEMRAGGLHVEATGRKIEELRAKNAPSGTFVRGIIDTLRKAGVPEAVQDQVFQEWLQTLPEVSLSKHSIHRRNVAGFDKNALRAFAKNSFHGVHQLAKMRYGQSLQIAREAMQESLDAYRKGSDELGENPTGATLAQTAKADAIMGEIGKRVDWIMNPTNSSLSNKLNSAVFVWYLGASPASALTNLTQVAQTVLPVLGAQHGWPKAMRVLGAAWRDAARTGGHLDRTLTDPDERRAFLVMQQRGDFSKTQAHSMAALAEGSVLQSSPTWSRAMGVVSFLFHQAEVINREATGMAAYRLARIQGKDFNEAIKYAGDINAGTNFDYSSSNRPRLMQGNFARIALQFRQYAVGMTWLFWRNFYKAMKGETPEIRREARRTVTGILGMTALLAGTTGLPIFNAVKYTANAANSLFGDDNEDYDFEQEYKDWLAEHLGREAANVIATGPASEITGADIADRTSLSNLWLQDSDQDLHGVDAYHALLEAIAGPLGGIGKSLFKGTDYIRRGNVQRGIETMLPTAVKNTMKAYRYASEGVNSLQGNPIVPDVSTAQEFIQALGFRPTTIAQQQQANFVAKGYEKFLDDRRSTLMNIYALALHGGDPSERAAAMQKIREYNQTHPEYPISARNLHASLIQRARASARAQNGIVLNRRVAARALEYAGAEQ